MGRYPEIQSRFPNRSKSDTVGVTLQVCADMIREAKARNCSLQPNQIAYVLRFLASTSGSDIELELTAKAGIAFHQLKDFVPRDN